MKPKAAAPKISAVAPFKTAGYPFFWIVHTAHRYLQTLEPELKKTGLDIPRWRVLMVLYEQSPSSVGEIAERSIIKLNTMTKIVQRMERGGLVACRPKLSDNRVTEVALTAKGDVARRKARKEADRIYRVTMTLLSARDIKRMNTLLARVFVNFDKVAKPK